MPSLIKPSPNVVPLMINLYYFSSSPWIKKGFYSAEGHLVDYGLVRAKDGRGSLDGLACFGEQDVLLQGSIGRVAPLRFCFKTCLRGSGKKEKARTNIDLVDLMDEMDKTKGCEGGLRILNGELRTDSLARCAGIPPCQGESYVFFVSSVERRVAVKNDGLKIYPAYRRCFRKRGTGTTCSSDRTYRFLFFP